MARTVQTRLPVNSLPVKSDEFVSPGLNEGELI